MKRLYRFKSLCTEFQDKPPNHAGISTEEEEEEEEEEQMVKIKLTYFNIEGVAEKVWCLCVCARETERVKSSFYIDSVPGCANRCALP
jgi:hypothetical protein